VFGGSRRQIELDRAEGQFAALRSAIDLARDFHGATIRFGIDPRSENI
jgi:hypothetical protein